MFFSLPARRHFGGTSPLMGDLLFFSGSTAGNLWKTFAAKP
jgi:hypothetical protein